MSSTAERFAKEYDNVKVGFTQPSVYAHIRVGEVKTEMAEWTKPQHEQLNCTLEILQSGKDSDGREAKGKINFVRLSFPEKGLDGMSEGAWQFAVGNYKRAMAALLAPGLKADSAEAKAAVNAELERFGWDAAKAIENREAVVRIDIDDGSRLTKAKDAERKKKLQDNPQNQIGAWYGVTPDNLEKLKTVTEAPARSGVAKSAGVAAQTL